MPRAFELTTEARSSIEQFRSALTDHRYWSDRLALGDAGSATLDSLVVDDDGTVRVVTTFGLVRDRLPALVKQLTRGDLQLTYRETWSPVDDSLVRGRLSAMVPGAPLSGTGTVLVSPRPEGSRLEVAGTVEVRIPVLGGPVERFLAALLERSVVDMHDFTSAWIAEHR